MEYNVVIRFAQPQLDMKGRLPTGSDGNPMRDADHKFEWTRQEFREWCRKQANLWGYGVQFDGVGTALDEEDWRLSLGDNDEQDVGHASQVRIVSRFMDH
jgi:small RNA 2'-O-methyltransferase